MLTVSTLAADISPEIDGIIKDIAQRIYNGEEITYDPELLRETAQTYMKAVGIGYGRTLDNVEWNSPDFLALEKIAQNVFKFSASKNYNTIRDMTLLLKDGNSIRSFEDFSAEVDKINVKYNHNWLRTEYNQAVASSQCAARWTDYGKRAENNPYLQYQAVMDANTRAEHAALNGVIKRYDDDFWDKYYPPNGWGCRCEVVQLPGKNHKETSDADLKYCKVDPMFQVNVGKSGKVFSEKHPYFMQRCRNCNGTPQNLAVHPQCAACVAGRKEGEKLIKEIETKRKKIDALNAQRDNVINSVTKNELLGLENIKTGFLYKSRKKVKVFLNHCYNNAEIETAESIIKNPDKLEFVRISPLGEGKKLKDPSEQDKLKNKVKRGIIQYHIYYYQYKGRRWCVKTEVRYDGEETLYSFTKKP
ncbi:MAG: minor capsid protein [Bacteroidales bacterium]|nr:minor capsid protein [Bacteroidales bacterium]